MTPRETLISTGEHVGVLTDGTATIRGRSGDGRHSGSVGSSKAGSRSAGFPSRSRLVRRGLDRSRMSSGEVARTAPARAGGHVAVHRAFVAGVVGTVATGGTRAEDDQPPRARSAEPFPPPCGYRLVQSVADAHSSYLPPAEAEVHICACWDEGKHLHQLPAARKRTTLPVYWRASCRETGIGCSSISKKSSPA
jgi:hypothetical protein